MIRSNTWNEGEDVLETREVRGDGAGGEGEGWVKCDGAGEGGEGFKQLVAKGGMRLLDHSLDSRCVF